MSQPLDYPQQIDVDLEINPEEYVNEPEQSEKAGEQQSEYLKDPEEQ